MDQLYFKMVGQKTADGKIILVAVVPEEFIGQDVPEIFDVQCVAPPKTIYTGTYPTIKINTNTIKDNYEESKGVGIAGIVLRTRWYCSKEDIQDNLGIGL